LLRSALLEFVKKRSEIRPGTQEILEFVKKNRKHRNVEMVEHGRSH